MKARGERADNLFTRLFAYAPRVGRQALEDYCTEALAWCLRNSPPFQEQFLNLTNIPHLYGRHIPAEVSTQVRFSGIEPDTTEVDSTGGVFDLVIEARHRPAFALVVEVKVGSGFGRGQLQKYRDQAYAPTAFEGVPKSSRFLVTLTTIAQHKTDLVDSAITWPRVHKALLASLSPAADPLFSKLLEQFAQFLSQKGLSMITLEKADATLLAGWSRVKLLETHLKQIVERLRNQEEIKPIVGRKVVKAFDDWVGIEGKENFWAGFGVSELASGAELYMWVEITVHSDRRRWKRHLDSRTKAALAEGVRYLAFHKDQDALNFDYVKDGASRIVLAKRVSGNLDGDAEAAFLWLYNTSKQLIRLAASPES